MALVTNLVWILFVGSVQCSYRQWHSSSWNNQNQNINGVSDLNEDNKQPWIINQASVQNVPMWRDLALSTEQKKQTISNRWPDTQSNTNLLRDWYKPDQQSSQDIQQDMSNKHILQQNVNTNLWHKVPVSDILLAEWTGVNPTSDGKQEMKKRSRSNPWNQLQIFANQMQSEPNKYLPSTNIKFGHMSQAFMNQRPQLVENNKPIIPFTENISNQVPLLINDIGTWYTKSKPAIAEVNTNMNIQWNMNSKPIYDQNPTMYSWQQTPATVNEPQNGYITMKPKQINKPQLQAAPSMNTWNQADKGNDISTWFSSQISAPEENHPKFQSNTPKLQSDMQAWNQISGGIASSTWNNNGNFVHEAGQNINTNTMPRNQIEAENKPSVSEKNEPDQLSNNVYGPSGWFINGNLPEKNEPDQNVKLGIEFNTNVNKWNQEVAENILAGWYNSGKMKNELQSNNNINGRNQEVIENETAAWNTKHHQFTKPELQLDSNAWNQAVSNNVPFEQNINMQSDINSVGTNPDMYRKVKPTPTSYVNNWNN